MIHLNIKKKTLLKVFLVVAACIVLYWFLHEPDRVRKLWLLIKNIFGPFVIGAGIAFILNVPVRWMEQMLKFIKKPLLRRIIAVVLTVLLVALILFLVIQLLVPQLARTFRSLGIRLPLFFESAKTTVMGFLDNNPQVWAWVQNNTKLDSMDWTSLVDKVVVFLEEKGGDIVGGTFKAIGSVGTGIFDAVVALVFAIYCLFRKEILARQARRLVYAFLPEKFCDETVRVMRLTSSTFANFISGQFLEACILGSLFAIAMLIFRMPYVPLISVLIAVTALVPIVGAFVGCIVGAFLILVEAGIVKALWFVVMFLIIQQFEGNVIYPKVVGKSVGLPGMWVLFAVSVGGELMGIAGMFVMIPVVSVLYTLLREVTSKRLEIKGVPRDKLQDQPPEYRVKLGRNANKPKRQWRFGKKKEEIKEE